MVTGVVMSKSIDEILLEFSYQIGIYEFMNTKWAWPTIESLHFLGLCLLIGAVGTFDFRMLGVAKNISLAALHRLIPIGVFGFSLNVITGSLFFLAAPAQYLYNPAFQTKISFMMCAGINMLFFYATTSHAVKQTSENIGLMARAKLIAIISLICWAGVITGGRLITFFRPPYHWCFWC